ncbi:MAG TPA: rhodanese-like domain-containing protein [Flavobacterium sp.]|nr:rhodanese-like domain-containing protein [Flavobacterium sp.]
MDLSQQEWAERLATDTNPVILDVRTEDEWNDGYIPGALHIDIYKGQGFVYEVDQLDKERPYYVYCKAGGRSAQACAIMGQLGFTTTYNLVGGFSQWGGEVVKP